MDYHILIVDDEKELCVSLSEILAEEGYPTAWTSDPLETPSILARTRVDLIILDIRMPGIGGIDLLRLVRKSNPNIKVIILTGHPSIENAVLSMKYGAANFYEKPPALKKLLNEIRELAARDAAGRDRTRARGAGGDAAGDQRPADAQDPPVRGEGGGHQRPRAHHR